MSKTGTGISKRNLRLALARELWADLKASNDPEKRTELGKLIKALTDGRKIKPKARQSVFDRASEQ